MTRCEICERGPFAYTLAVIEGWVACYECAEALDELSERPSFRLLSGSEQRREIVAWQEEQLRRRRAERRASIPQCEICGKRRARLGRAYGLQVCKECAPAVQRVGGSSKGRSGLISQARAKVRSSKAQPPIPKATCRRCHRQICLYHTVWIHTAIKSAEVIRCERCGWEGGGRNVRRPCEGCGFDGTLRRDHRASP